MKLLIFVATAATGIELVTQALQRGHAVTALVRDPARLKQTHELLRIVAGNVMDPASI